MTPPVSGYFQLQVYSTQQLTLTKGILLFSTFNYKTGVCSTFHHLFQQTHFYCTEGDYFWKLLNFFSA